MGWGGVRAFRGLTRSAPLKVARASKISGRKFSAFARRKPTGLTSAEMAALRGNAAARSGFLLAAAPFGRRAGQPSEGAPTDTARSPRAGERGASPFAAAGRRAHDSRASARTRTSSLAIFSTPGTHRDGSIMGTELRIVAAEACGAVCGQTGTDARRVVRLPMADSLCDRMERGEEEADTGRRVASQSSQFLQTLRRVRLPTSGRRKFPSGNFRRARDLEGAKRVSRGQAQRAKPQESPLARRPHRTDPPPQPLQARPCLLGIEECPHYFIGE